MDGDTVIIAKPEWFERRKYTGWGLSIKTWQGAAYLVVIFSLLIALQLIPNLSTETRLVLTGFWLAFLLVDMLDVMWNIKKDERDYIHEAVAERNAAWGMIVIISIGIFIELVYNALQQKIYVDPFLIAALVFGAVIKSVTNYKLEKDD
ncbi:hypothetical protein A9507_13165 [Methanobacterium sp. A39]|nr:hypothetical protein A9507_13165 [Methanobacterium sp. A39]